MASHSKSGSGLRATSFRPSTPGGAPGRAIAEASKSRSRLARPVRKRAGVVSAPVGAGLTITCLSAGK